MKRKARANCKITHQDSGTRTSAGNMLILCAAMTGVVFSIAALGITLECLVCQRSKLQTQTEQSIMQTACRTNENDATGKMNNLVSRSRELVFASRQTRGTIDNNYPDLTALADQLLAESRQGARIIAQEREQLAASTSAAIVETVTKSASSTAGFSLPFITSSKPSVYKLEAGFMQGVDSNVEAPAADQQLRAFDRSQGYIQESSNLYKGNINARLPAPDNDLDFKLASLPAPVEGTTAPARLSSGQKFGTLADLIVNGSATGRKCDQLPSAMRLTMHMATTSELSRQYKGTLACSQAAGTAGGTTTP